VGKGRTVEKGVKTTRIYTLGDAFKKGGWGGLSPCFGRRVENEVGKGGKVRPLKSCCLGGDKKEGMGRFTISKKKHEVVQGTVMEEGQEENKGTLNSETSQAPTP